MKWILPILLLLIGFVCGLVAFGVEPPPPPPPPPPEPVMLIIEKATDLETGIYTPILTNTVYTSEPQAFYRLRIK